MGEFIGMLVLAFVIVFFFKSKADKKRREMDHKAYVQRQKELELLELQHQRMIDGDEFWENYESEEDEK